MPDSSKKVFPYEHGSATTYRANEGMTLRQYYAGQVIAHWTAVDGEQWRGTEIPPGIARRIAQNAVTMADALIDALR